MREGAVPHSPASSAHVAAGVTVSALTAERGRSVGRMADRGDVGRDYAGAVTLRIRVDLSYDGTAFSGWAAQPGLRTVEGTLSEALTVLLRRTDAVRLVVAGRTDAGVHARGQVAHLDVQPAEWEGVRGRSGRPAEDALASRLNRILPSDVVVRRVRRTPDGFDARFSALRRRYLYRLCDDPAALDPLRRHDT